MELSQLPAGVRRIVIELGVGDAILLLEACGGTNIRLLSHRVPPSVFVDVLGEIRATRLVNVLIAAQHDQHETALIYLPKPDKILIQLRDAEIIASLEAGETQPDVARRFHISQRWVGQIYRRSRSRSVGMEQNESGKSQLNLF